MATITTEISNKISNKNEYSLLILAMLLWGASWPVGKITSEIQAPFTLAFWRFFTASCFLIPVFLFTHKLDLNRIRRGLLNFLFLGAVGVIGYNFFFFVGLRYTTASSGAMVAGANPILVSTFAILFLGETIYLRKFFGFLCGAIGVVMVIGIDALEGTGWEGNFLIFLAMVTWATYFTRVKQLTKSYSAFELTTYSIVAGTVLLIPLGLFERNFELYQQIDTKLDVWCGIIYLGIFASGFALIFFNRGVEKLGNSRSGVFINLVPIFGTFLSVIFLNESITYFKILGLVFVITGVIIVNLEKNNDRI